MASISLPKGYQRLGAFPLDDTFVFDTLASLETYATTNASAYAGQICVVSSTSEVYIIKVDISTGEKSLSNIANSQVIVDHIADEKLHLTAGQNTLLDGITVTKDTINYLTNVSSNIQSQLDGKSATNHGHADATTLASGFLSASDKTKLNGIASGAEVNVNADWTATSGDAAILNKPTLGSASASDVADFATAAQGVKADSALQPLPVVYLGDYNNGLSYTYGDVVKWQTDGQLYKRIGEPNPGYPPGTSYWQLFEVAVGSPAYDLFITAQLNTKVDKVDGQDLSDENYTSDEKNKLAAIVPSKLINGLNEVELRDNANLHLAQGGGIVFDRNNTSINVGMGFHIRSGEGVAIEPVDQGDGENLITRGWNFDPSGALTAPDNNNYYARSHIVLNNFPAQDSGFGLTTADGVTHDFYYDYDGVVGAGTPILVDPLTDSISDVALKTVAVLTDSALFGYVHWDSTLNYVWIYQNVAGPTGNQPNYSYSYTDGLSEFAGGEVSRIVFGDGTVQSTAPTTDAYLLDRAHHTGTQPYTTITGLGTLATQSGTFSGTSSNVNTGDQTITLTGDVTGSGTGNFSTTLKDTGVVAGEYNSSTTSITPFTVDSKGRITAINSARVVTPDWGSIANTPTTLGEYGITNAVNTIDAQIIGGAKEFSASPIVPRPTASNHAVNKAYADDISAGLHVHEQVHVILTIALATATGGTVVYTNGTDGVGAKLTVTGGSTIIAALNAACGADDDLIAGANGSRIIINGEADNKNWNGIYIISADRELTRAADFDSSVEMAGGDFVFVTHGISYADTGWVSSEAVTTVGTSPVEFVQFSGQGAYDAGDGLQRDGTVFSVVGTADRIVVGPSVDLATHGTAGTYHSVTTDEYGRVTSGTKPTTLEGYGITDAAALSGATFSGPISVTSADLDGISSSSTDADAIVGSSTNGRGGVFFSANSIGLDVQSSNSIGLVVNSSDVALKASRFQFDGPSGNIAEFYAGFNSVFSILSAGGVKFGNIFGDTTLTVNASTANTGHKTITFPAENGTVALASTTLSGYGITDAVSKNTVIDTSITGQSKTFTNSDNAKVFHVTGVNTLTLPVWLDVDPGWSVGVVNMGGSALTFARSSTDTVNGLTAFANSVLYSAVYIYRSPTAGSFVAIIGDQTITLTGDVSGSGVGIFATTLKDTGPGVGTYQSVTIDNKGRVTAGTNPTTLSGYGITDVAIDNKQYARKNQGWEEITSAPDDSNTIIGLSLFL